MLWHCNPWDNRSHAAGGEVEKPHKNVITEESGTKLCRRDGAAAKKQRIEQRAF
jgi:hypothetical protein